jgi:hypothetical protein
MCPLVVEEGASEGEDSPLSWVGCRASREEEEEESKQEGAVCSSLFSG